MNGLELFMVYFFGVGLCALTLMSLMWFVFIFLLCFENYKDLWYNIKMFFWKLNYIDKNNFKISKDKTYLKI